MDDNETEGSVYRGAQMTWGSRNAVITEHRNQSGEVVSIAVNVSPNLGETIRTWGPTKSARREDIEQALDRIEQGIREAREWLSQHC